MKYILFVLGGLFVYSTAIAGVGDIDQRVYVDWSTPPYNNIVYFYPKPYFTCTAQYVASDIILTARHCVVDTRKFDKYAAIGQEYEIWTHDNRRTTATLEKYGRNFKNDDWALLRISDPTFHRSTYFNASSKTQYGTITSAGFAGMRILTNDEISIAKQVFEDVATQQSLTNYNEIFQTSSHELQTKYNIYLRDNRIPGSKTPGEWEYRLKATPNCHIESRAITSDLSFGWFKSSCDTDHGDSGGPYFSGNILYGIVSGGLSGFDDSTNKNLGVRAERFAHALKKMKTNSPDIETDYETDESDEPEIETQLSNIESDLNTRTKNIKNMTDRDFFEYLRDGIDYQTLKENYERARERETSQANRLLGGLAIGATGIGGMMLASGLAEKSADEAAEAAMRAYLATFTCNYGDGKNVRGGEQNVELPGGNDLMKLKSEYIALARDLKQRKEQLEMQPGIESETIYDSATAGLYDDVSTGKTSGAYISLSRALLDETGADAAAWAQQKSDTEKKIKTGGIVGGVGAVGGLVGDLIINRDKDQDDN